MGLWDYDDDEVEEYERGEQSSPSCASDSEDGGTKAKKGARKGRGTAASKKRNVPSKAPKPVEEDDPLDDDIIVIDSDSEDDILQHSKRSKQAQPAPPPKASTPPVPSPSDYLDSETSKKIKQNDELLRRLEAATRDSVDSDDSDDEPPPARAQRTYSSYLPTLNFPRASPAQPAPSAVNPSTPVQPHATSLGAAAADAPATGNGENEGGQDEGETIIITLQCKQGKPKMKIHKHKPFSIMVARFRQHAERCGWAKPGQSMKLMFDGDVLNENSTAEDLDLEGDETIDVIF